jgi:hypothetical protein
LIRIHKTNYINHTQYSILTYIHVSIHTYIPHPHPASRTNTNPNPKQDTYNNTSQYIKCDHPRTRTYLSYCQVLLLLLRSKLKQSKAHQIKANPFSLHNLHRNQHSNHRRIQALSLWHQAEYIHMGRYTTRFLLYVHQHM